MRSGSGVVSTISSEKIKKYFSVTKKALEMALNAPYDDERSADKAVVLDMASRYVSDAEHFFNKGDWVLAFAALNYAHGWLDAGARLGLFVVKDSKLFTVDD